MIKKSKLTFIFSVIAGLAFIFISLLTESCRENPTSLGLNLLNPSETLGVKVFDSFKDTMVITTTSKRININTGGSGNLLVGKDQNYNSMALVNFNSLSSNYDTAVVASAVLKLKYRNYYFPVTNADSLGTIAFNIYTVQQYHNYGFITYDSINSISFGTTSVGTYSGAPAHDTQEVDIPLDLSTVHNWLEYAHNSSYTPANYGVVLYPTNASNTIKAFYSSTQGSNAPVLQITFSSNHDTINSGTSQTVFLANGALTQVPGSFKILSGVGYDEIIKFDASRISSTYLINDAELILTFDGANSIFTNQTTQNILWYMIVDTTNDSASGITVDYNNAYISNYQLQFHITSPFQKWARGVSNYGLILKGSNYASNLDQFAFFDQTASDPTKRPHIIIRYSLRVP